ncbi:hypothetical protein STEG23_027361, partial [Scotinomys teguina]
HSPTNLIKEGHEQKRKSRNAEVALSTRHGCLCCPSVDVEVPKKNFCANEGMDVLARPEQAGKEQKCPSSTSLYGFQQNVWPRVKVCLPTSRSRSKYRSPACSIVLPTFRMGLLNLLGNPTE